jgi:O-antigen/teichoic acid export membrane protein
MATEGNSHNNQDISKTSGVKTSFWDYLSLLSGNLILIPLGIASVALMTRILGPEGYGYVTIFNLVSAFVVMVTTNWNATSLIRFGREEYDQQGKLNHAFWARTIILTPCLIIGLVIIYLGRSFINDYMKMPSWTIWLVMVSILIITIRTYFDYMLQAIHRMKSYAASQIFFTVGSIVSLALIVFGVFPKTYLTVIIVGLITNTIIIILLSLFLIPHRVLSPVKTDRSMLQKVFSFSYPMLIGNLAAYVVNWVDVIVIKQFFSMSDVGGYQLAYSMFNLLTGLLSSITILITPILVSFLAVRREDLVLRYSTRLVPQGFLLWTTLIGIVVSICPPMFRIVFGEGFGVSAIYFQFLAIGLVISGLINFYSGEITAYKLMKLGVMASVSRGVVNLMGDILFVPQMGPLGAALSTTGGIIVAALCYLLICQRQLHEKILWQFILALPALLSLGINRIFSGPETPVLAIVITLVSSLYLARALRLFRPDDLILFDFVQMPSSLRKAIVGVYPFLMTKSRHRGKEVIS